MDDHRSVLDGLGLVFCEEGLELVATATSAEAGLDAAAEHQPDVAVMDVRLPGMSGIAAVESLRSVAPRTAVVVYSAYGDRRVLTEAIGAGARGYVLKGSPMSDLVRAVRAVAAGDAFVDPTLSPTLLMDPTSHDAPLAEREREILRLLADGLGTEQAAERIGVSVETVKADTRRAVERLQATGRVHAVANALRRSYIT